MFLLNVELNVPKRGKGMVVALIQAKERVTADAFIIVKPDFLSTLKLK